MPKLNTNAAKVIIALLSASISLQACTNKQTKSLIEFEYIIFGSYAGECLGDCATLFKIENEKLYIDIVEFPFGHNSGGFYPKEITFEQKALPQEHYDIAQRVLTNFPEELSKIESQEFGCPDCDDRGAIYLEINLQGTRKIWTIDTSEQLIEPSFMISYRKELIEVLQNFPEI